MTRYSFHPLILCVLGLSIVGLFHRLYKDPVELFSQLLFMVVFASIIFFLVKKFLAHKHSNSTNYGSHQPQPKRMNFKTSNGSKVAPHKNKKDTKKISRPLVKKRTEVNLTVIEGKKSKKKNRALF
ncbi:hypothetical protein BKP45_09510 [Anaerobacillus alkalidiazotrophicus]|uniref:Uncharacterized protein n=1 Tax=Anaerobacillus alkalidiazotrophicus TaxID=472963 RepID=A0A1S2M692_9BACI|nr:SA1362 family protein [Anaerobacillus alkalidiazotrophicus]OIJ20292.1 hypothetical protein BKP45_09510 [Anaerobacillus alkalidiazotrophicus]